MDSAAPAGGTVVVQVNAGPTPQPQHELQLEAWTNAARSGDVLNATETPLIIYASVSSRGGRWGLVGKGCYKNQPGFNQPPS